MKLTALLGSLLAAATACAQLSERPGGMADNPIDSPRDLSGLSIKEPRVKIIHTTDPALEGGSMWLQQRDPWLAWQWGRHLFQREFRERDGVYGDSGKIEGMRLGDGATKIASRSHVNSCAVCHSSPYRDAGAGSTIAKNGGTGRNTPHLFGAGLLEMLGTQMRDALIAGADKNHDGWISLAEAAGRTASIRPAPGAEPLDFGRYDDVNGDGKPDLNDIAWPIYVDEEGRRMPAAASLKTPGVAGYRLDVQVFGYGHLHLPHRPPLASTVRTFAGNTFDLHQGMVPYDPSCLVDRDGTGFTAPTNAGCPQPMTQAGRDRGAAETATGISRDDPDRDGYCHEISEGEMDMVEWYHLNHPAPARGEPSSAATAGEARFHSIGCAQCHTADWRVEKDRRFFDLQTAWNPTSSRLEGRLVSLAEKKDGHTLPRGGSHDVRGLFSDLRYHDMGDGFAQQQFDGTVIRRWRTTPLWGAGSTAPYGHDGASLSLQDVILRHGGEAAPARDAFAALPQPQRAEVTAFLERLVLYQTDQLPCDLDGDGKISQHFSVAGQDTGTERLNPEWLFRTPGRIEGPVTNPQGQPVTSFALTNLNDAYSLTLPLMKDTDGDFFPDVMDPEPLKPGWRDGVK